jgi:hypothetical protein
MRVQIQLRIVTDDDDVLSDDVIACFNKGDDQLEEIGLSLDQAKTVLASVQRATESVGGCSGCGSEWGGLNIVGGHGRIPGGEQVAQRAVEGSGSGLQEPMGTFLRPLHLLLLGEALADDEVDGGFGEGGRDDLAMVPALAVVRDRGGVVLEVGTRCESTATLETLKIVECSRSQGFDLKHLFCVEF